MDHSLVDMQSVDSLHFFYVFYVTAVNCLLTRKGCPGLFSLCFKTKNKSVKSFVYLHTDRIKNEEKRKRQ